MTPKYYILSSFVPLVKHSHVTEEDDDDKPLKITFQYFNVFLRCAVNNGELLYMIFLHVGVCTLGIYFEDPVPEHLFFPWTCRTKIHRIYQRLLK